MQVKIKINKQILNFKSNDFRHINIKNITTCKKAKHSTHSKVLQREIPVCNRFESLYKADSDCNKDVDDEESEWNFSEVTKNKKYTCNKNIYSRSNVIYKYPDNDQLYVPHRSAKHVLGANSYGGTIKERRKVCIIGDGIIQRIRISDVNNELNNGNAFKKVDPGGTVEEIEQYTNKILEKKDIECDFKHGQ